MSINDPDYINHPNGTEPQSTSKLFEFLNLGPQKYCAKYHMQACTLCNRTDCCDNDNPVVLELKRTQLSLLATTAELNRLKTRLSEALGTDYSL